MKLTVDFAYKNRRGREPVGEAGEAIMNLPDSLAIKWWQMLCAVSAANILIWVFAAWTEPWNADLYRSKQLVLSGFFVSACAFRSLFPRVDVERICLWDSPLSSIVVGRSIATIAEICFAWQCVLLLSKLAALTGSPVIGEIGLVLLPIVIVAELACWYAVVTLNHIGHAVEELLWAIMIGLVAAGLLLYWRHGTEAAPLWVPVGLVACAGAAVLMLMVDIPLYIARWRMGKNSGLRYLCIVEGLKDTVVRRRGTQTRDEWRNEMLWMTLYFSAGVWVSLGMIFV